MPKFIIPNIVSLHNAHAFLRLQRDDLMQASVVLATFVWQAAVRDERLPRKPMPTEMPRPTPTPVASAGKREVFDVARGLHQDVPDGGSQRFAGN